MEQISLTDALVALADEITRAREKFKPREMLGEALGEEVGEWARSEDRDQPGNEEALHIACVALRIYSEGSTPTAEAVRNNMKALESMSRLALEVLKGRKTP